MVDQVKISVRAGNGGAGAVSFRREKFIPKGGPDGGDGGKGGNVYLETDTNINTLQDFAHNKKFAGGDGERGQGKKMSGAKGEDITIKVPVGTLVKLTRLGVIDLQGQALQMEDPLRPGLEGAGEKEVRVRGMSLGVSGKLISQKKLEGETWQSLDLCEPDMKILIARGGKGGRGNVHFKGARRTTPMIAEDGQSGELFEADLELKLLADVGLVGLPNSGKSTLLSVLSSARPKIADYEFTTLEPNLGVLKLDNKHLVIADIPGLIEGASEGKGLGIRFLRHIERCRVLVHLLDGAKLLTEPAKSLVWDYEIVRNELASYSKSLLTKPEIVVLNKIDVLDKKQTIQILADLKKAKIKVIAISAASHENLEELKKKLV